MPSGTLVFFKLSFNSVTMTRQPPRLSMGETKSPPEAARCQHLSHRSVSSSAPNRSQSQARRRSSASELHRGRMVASVCDIGTSVRSRSRRISRDDVSKRAARSLSRAVATRQRSKSLVRDDDDEEENDPVYSKSSRRYTTESVSMFSRGGRSSRPERHRFEASDPSLFSKDDRTNSQDGSHGNHGMIKMGSKSRTHVVPPPPPRKIVDVNKSPPPEKMNSSLVSADSGQTESTHPSTSYNSSEPDMSLALVPYGNKQEKTLPLPPSPEPRRHSRRSSRGGDRLHRSHRDLAPRLEEESAIDISSRSESRLERRDRRSLGRSKSRSRRSAPRENVLQ